MNTEKYTNVLHLYSSFLLYIFFFLSEFSIQSVFTTNVLLIISSYSIGCFMFYIKINFVLIMQELKIWKTCISLFLTVALAKSSKFLYSLQKKVNIAELNDKNKALDQCFSTFLAHSFSKTVSSCVHPICMYVYT